MEGPAPGQGGQVAVELGADQESGVEGLIEPLPEPLSYAGPAAAIWMVIGVVYLVVLLTTRPAKIDDGL